MPFHVRKWFEDSIAARKEVIEQLRYELRGSLVWERREREREEVVGERERILER